MSCKPLSSLSVQDMDVIIQVQVNRKWEFRGGTDDGPVMHVVMILTDSTGDAIYAEIPAYLAQEKSPLFEIGKFYKIRRFKVAPAKSFYRVIDGPHMIYVTPYTIVEAWNDPPSTFPEYVYRLSPYNEIDPYGPKAKDFHDVIGIITETSELETVQSKRLSTSTVKRDVLIQDTSDNIMRITLWGTQANQFSYESVYDVEKREPVVVLFVGCLPREFSGKPFLSGSSACHWYFNPKIPEAETYYSKIISEQITSHLPPLSNELIPTCEPLIRKHRQLNDLLDSNPYDLPEEGCEVTVTITRILENKTWWYISCSKSPNKVTLESTGYKCTRCGLTTHTFRYRLGFMASDRTAEAEMFCFDNIARSIIGKPCSSIIASAGDTTAIPPEIAAIVSLKFTFAVTFNKRSFSSPYKVLLINSILGTHGREHSFHHVQQNVPTIQPSTPVKQASIFIFTTYKSLSW